MSHLTDYKLNFTYDKISDFVGSQLPAFVRTESPDFVAFVEAYYRFLESKLVEITVSTIETLIGDLEIGEIVSTVHPLMGEDGNYLGDGTDAFPLLELESYRDNSNQLIRPTRIIGSALGSSDIDNETIGSDTPIPRKKLMLNHLSGSVERLLEGDEESIGELFSITLLQSITANTSLRLPTIFDVKSIETPLNAMNNMFNYGDIDYSFNNSLFLGSDYYSLMAKELMPRFPRTLYSSTEEKMKALIGRNIKDFYRSKGTEDSIKFILRLLYGIGSDVFVPSNKLFNLNDGRWITNYKLKVLIDSERDVLNSSNRVVYIIVLNDLLLEDNVSHLSQENNYYTIELDGYRDQANTLIHPVVSVGDYYAYTENVYVDPEDSDYAILELSNVYGGEHFIYGNKITGTLLSGEQFECEIGEDLSKTTYYSSNRGLLNGGVLGDLPEGFSEWDANAALEVASTVEQDRIQDGDYWQLFSYAVRLSMNESLKIEQTTTTDFSLYETVTGSVSGATGSVIFWNPDSNAMNIIMTEGCFVLGETIIGSTSGAESVITESLWNNVKENLKKLVHPAGFKLFVEPVVLT